MPQPVVEQVFEISSSEKFAFTQVLEQAPACPERDRLDAVIHESGQAFSRLTLTPDLAEYINGALSDFVNSREFQGDRQHPANEVLTEYVNGFVYRHFYAEREPGLARSTASRVFSR